MGIKETSGKGNTRVINSTEALTTAASIVNRTDILMKYGYSRARHWNNRVKIIKWKLGIYYAVFNRRLTKGNRKPLHGLKTGPGYGVHCVWLC